MRSAGASAELGRRISGVRWLSDRVPGIVAPGIRKSLAAQDYFFLPPAFFDGAGFWIMS